MAERLSDNGYMAISVETVKGTPATVPNIFVPLYGESMSLSMNNMVDSPIIGQKYEKYQILPGKRAIQGTIEIVAEPNTAGHAFNMLLTKGAPSGSGPYTYQFLLSTTVDPKSYTVDFAKGRVVHRYTGVEASEIKPSVVDNELHLSLKTSALKSFQVRKVTSIATTSVVLDSTFISRPTDGLVVGDLVAITKANGTTADFSIASINVDGVTITLNATAAAFAAGDKFHLRPATVSTTLLTPFLWTSTQFCFGANATAALAASHTPVEEGSDWTIQHRFNKEDGEHRSGSQDAVALARTRGNADVQIKKAFDVPSDLDDFQNLVSGALVIRHFSGAYELRLTFEETKIMEHPNPLKAGELIYADMKLAPQYNATAGRAFDVKVINAIASF